MEISLPLLLAFFLLTDVPGHSLADASPSSSAAKLRVLIFFFFLIEVLLSPLTLKGVGLEPRLSRDTQCFDRGKLFHRPPPRFLLCFGFFRAPSPLDGALTLFSPPQPPQDTFCMRPPLRYICGILFLFCKVKG